jgi:3-hydroxybutyryl-CoA dehydrogenase
MESSVCICGAGTMGRGISLATAAKGIPVILYDLDATMISSAAILIRRELEQEFEKKRISSDEKENIFKQIRFTSSISDCRAPLIIEAIVEKSGAKESLMIELERINPEKTIFATNTSSLSVTGIAMRTPFPEKIIGLHFFNPANRMKLVEVIRTNYISEELINRMAAFVLQLGKTPVVCKDAPGFIVNRVARPFYLEALRLAEESVTDIATIDKLMESAGFRMGPFHLIDLIGNDINYMVSCSVYEALGRPARLKPSGWQAEIVKKGSLGIKSGNGFFQYSKSFPE